MQLQCHMHFIIRFNTSVLYTCVKQNVIKLKLMVLVFSNLLKLSINLKGWNGQVSLGVAHVYTNIAIFAYNVYVRYQHVNC